MRLIDAVEEVYKNYDVVTPLYVCTHTREDDYAFFEGVGEVILKMSGYAIRPIEGDEEGNYLTMALSDEIEGYEYEYDSIYKRSIIYAQLKGD